MKFEKLEEIIKQIANTYFIALRQINLRTFSSGELNKYSPFYIYYADVEYAFSSLKKVEREVINKEYFYNDFSDWWINKYKVREFKRLKTIAIKNFLEVFYEIH